MELGLILLQKCGMVLELILLAARLGICHYGLFVFAPRPPSLLVRYRSTTQEGKGELSQPRGRIEHAKANAFTYTLADFPEALGSSALAKSGDEQLTKIEAYQEQRERSENRASCKVGFHRSIL